jgi:hypothetical protein
MICTTLQTVIDDGIAPKRLATDRFRRLFSEVPRELEGAL